MSADDLGERSVSSDQPAPSVVPTTGVAGPVGGSGPGAIGATRAGSSLSLPIETALKHLVEGYLLGDLASMATEITVKEIGSVGYPMVMAALSGSELLAALATDEKTDNRIQAYWVKYMARVDARYGDLGQIASQLARNGIAHSYLSHFGVLVVRGQPQRHLSLSDHEVIFDCVKLYEHFRQSYLEYARPYLLEHAEDAQRRLDKLLEHDLVKASSLIGALPAARFPTARAPDSMATVSASISGGTTLAPWVQIRGSGSNPEQL